MPARSSLSGKERRIGMSPDSNAETTMAPFAQSPDNRDKRTYTVAEISDLLQISRSKAYDLCGQGFFKSIRIGRSVRVSKSSFDEWLDNQ
jgi:excisionase family DNA binding protein